MFISEPKLNKNTTYIQKQTAPTQSIRSTRLCDELIFSRRKQSPPKIKNQIQATYSQIHRYIENVDKKIRNILQTQSNQYKIVYQHYFNKFKSQLAQLKQKTLQQQQQFASNTRTKFLESQLSFFTQQTIKYKKQSQKLLKQNLQLRQKLRQKQDDLKFYSSCGKVYLKQIKLLNSTHRKIQSERKISVEEDMLRDYENVRNQAFDIKNENMEDKANQYSQQKSQSDKHLKQQFNIKDINLSSNHRKKFSLTQFQKFNSNNNKQKQLSKRLFNHKHSLSSTHQQLQKHKNNFSYDHTNNNFYKINQKKSTSFRSNQKVRIKTQYKQPSTNKQNSKYQLKSIKINPITKQKQFAHTRTQLSQKAEQNYSLFNICEWFMNCVTSVYKEICYRKTKFINENKINHNKLLINHNKFLESFEEFQKNDKFQILLKFVLNDHIIKMIYDQMNKQRAINKMISNRPQTVSKSFINIKDPSSNCQSKILQQNLQQIQNSFSHKLNQTTQKSTSFIKSQQKQPNHPANNANTLNSNPNIQYQQHKSQPKSRSLQKRKSQFNKTLINMLYHNKGTSLNNKKKNINIWKPMKNNIKNKNFTYDCYTSMYNNSNSSQYNSSNNQVKQKQKQKLKINNQFNFNNQFSCQKYGQEKGDTFNSKVFQLNNSQINKQPNQITKQVSIISLKFNKEKPTIIPNANINDNIIVCINNTPDYQQSYRVLQKQQKHQPNADNLEQYNRNLTLKELKKLSINQKLQTHQNKKSIKQSKQVTISYDN